MDLGIVLNVALLCHLVGDYVLQSDWMALEKTKRSAAALAHVVTYVLPFLVLTRNIIALLLIAATHFVIDRWRLARYVCWVKNWMAPWPTIDGELCIPFTQKPWAECQATGYDPARPSWLTVWLLIITDNTMHLICNALILWRFCR